MSSILIVEDEAGIASFLEKGLRGEGYTTSVVTDGPSALAAALGGEFDLIVLDLGLPVLDGTKVLRSLRAAGSDVPVIVLTARSGIEDVVAGLEGGADDYVAKPFRFRELSARIKVQLRARSGGGDSADRLAHGGLVLDLRSRRVE
ncbi:response regulator transcription factor, partial [Motilibacter deserti]|nr:response regulator transcription factor [Motilibacter deserti]